MPNPYSPLTSDNSGDQNTLGSRFSRPLFSSAARNPSSPARGRLGLSRRPPSFALTGLNGASSPGADTEPDGWLPADKYGVTRLRSSVTADNPYQPIAPNTGPADHGIFGLDPGVRRGPAAPVAIVDPNAPKPGRMDSTPVGSRDTMFSRNGDGSTNTAGLPLAAQTLPAGVAAAPGSGNTELGKVAAVPLVPPPPQQTERADPLSGDTSPVPGGATVDVNPATPQNPAQPQNQALGFSSQGTATPQTQDATPGSYTGGVGLYKKTFSSRRGADAYHQFTRDLFGDSTTPAVADRD